MANKAYKYRIYPNAAQQVLFAKTFGCARFVYNQVLNEQTRLFNDGQKQMSKFDANYFCNHALKDAHPWLREVDKFALSNSVFALDFAYKRFFQTKGKMGRPNFKSKHNSKLAYSTNMSNNNIAVGENFIKLPKAGRVKAVIHRPLPEKTIIKAATVSRTAGGAYYCSVCFEYQAHIPVAAIPTQSTTLGLDYSSYDFYVDSNNRTANYSPYYRKTEKKLAQQQRKLSRKKLGSKNREKQRRKLAAIHEKITNQRKDFCHQLSKKIANSYDAVCVEDMNLRGLAGSLKLGKSTNDNGFGMFRTFLKYKLEEQGKPLIVINKWYPSSKMCHECGTINPDLKLEDREWTCSCCGTPLYRDYNAAKNIRDVGLSQYLAEIGA